MVVEYVPGTPLKVSLSRKRNLFDALEDVVEIKPDPEVEHTEKKKGGKKIVTNPRTRLRITMPDGSIIEERTAWESLYQFVLKVGVDTVRAVGLIANKIPLVSNTIDKKIQNRPKAPRQRLASHDLLRHHHQAQANPCYRQGSST